MTSHEQGRINGAARTRKYTESPNSSNNGHTGIREVVLAYFEQHGSATQQQIRLAHPEIRSGSISNAVSCMVRSGIIRKPRIGNGQAYVLTDRPTGKWRNPNGKTPPTFRHSIAREILKANELAKARYETLAN